MPLAIRQIYRRAAHARDGTRMFQIGPVAADQDHIVLRIEIVQDRHDLDLEAVNSRPLEHAQAIAFHARLHFGNTHMPCRVEE